MKKILASFLFCSLLHISFAQNQTIIGKVTDAKTGIALPYITVALAAGKLGTSTNADGEFSIKSNNAKDTLKVSCVGYKIAKFPINKLNESTLLVALEEDNIELSEVRILPFTPTNLLIKVVEAVGDNYATNAQEMKAFYRESKKENESYTEIIEAVLNIYAGSYLDKSDKNQAKILKGQVANNTSDGTVKTRIYGGTDVCINDPAKVIRPFMKPENFKNYDYTFGSQQSYEHGTLLTIEFEMKDGIKQALEKGTIKIDADSYAIVEMHTALSPKGSKYALDMTLKTKLAFSILGGFARLDFSKTDYTFRKYQDKWYLNSSSWEVQLSSKASRKKPDFVSNSKMELVITEIGESASKPFEKSEALVTKGELVKQISGYDPAFWENYNTIRPNQSIIKAARDLTDTTLAKKIEKPKKMEVNLNIRY